jgi:hypothetical protein
MQLATCDILDRVHRHLRHAESARNLDTVLITTISETKSTYKISKGKDDIYKLLSFLVR